jgi:hypothetical protein
MEQLSEELIDRLLRIENEGEADRRAELTNERFLSLIHDPEDGHAYVLRHGLDDTEGAEVPGDVELWEYDEMREAEVAFAEMLAEARRAGELVDEDSEEDLGDTETAGAELHDVYSADDDDPLVRTEEDET